MRIAFLLLALGCPLACGAAASFQLVTPRSISVAGGESRDVSVRFLDAGGRPAAGERATFSNDACGTFANGQFTQASPTDANGIATARFTASNPPGITCWITVGAGVTATFDVLTYRVSEVNLQATLIPPEPRIGEPYILRVRPAYGAYGLDDVEVTARVLPGVASATLSPSSANTGEEGFADFVVTPSDAIGDYAITASFRTRSTTVAVPTPAAPWQDLWWAGPAENGWGMSIVQHREVLFAVLYAYDAEGRPTWFVIPSGRWNAAHTEYTGEVYVPTGSPFHAYDPARFLVGPAVGTVKLAFSGAGTAILDYEILGRSGRKLLSRNAFGPSQPAGLKGLGDMWWGGERQAGWGVAVLQQHATLFTIWFTYDDAGAPTWFVMPGGSWIDAQTYAGRIFRATSSAWLGVGYDAARFRTTDVGSFRLRFSGQSANLDYSVDGRTGTLALGRWPF